MIRIVTDVYYAEAERPDIWMKFPMVPASGTLAETDEHDENGWLRTVKLEFRIGKPAPYLQGNLLLEAVFCDRSRLRIGTADLPVRLKTERSSQRKVSVEWQTVLR